MTIRIRRAFPVRLFADGHARVFLTAAGTVAEFLQSSGVRVRARDHIYPAQDAAVWAGATVRVVRIETRVIAVEERLPYGRVARPDATLPRGQTRLLQSGRPGVRTHRIAVTTADGLEVDRQRVDAVVTRPPQDRITRVGTRRVFASRGDYAGKEVLHMEATGYAPWHGQGVDDVTAIGMKAGYGVVAVDPQVIPLRSVLYIEGYGRAIAGDTGGAIKGNRIDLGFGTAREAYRFGRRPVRVYILSMPPAKT
jgi:3D (Asp-Asp-Asp) domain-containing protein